MFDGNDGPPPVRADRPAPPIRSYRCTNGEIYPLPFFITKAFPGEHKAQPDAAHAPADHE